MSISSMTGFASSSCQDEEFSWSWEVKSVNGRALEIRCHLPSGMDRLIPRVRAAVSRRLTRGNVTAKLQISPTSGYKTMQINRPWLDELIAVTREYRGVEGILEPRIDGMLGLPGVIESVGNELDKEVQEGRDNKMLSVLETTLNELVITRNAEGTEIAEALETKVAEIANLTQTAEKLATKRLDPLRGRLREQVKELIDTGAPFPEDRLATEIALLATKIDVTEEIDRLKTHCTTALQSLNEGKAVGRKLDFLAQELNREANTLCSKASDEALIGIGLEIKMIVDQFREHAHNVE